MVRNKQLSRKDFSVVKDQAGKDVEICLKYKVYENILEEMEQLKQKISELKKKKLTNKS